MVDVGTSVKESEKIPFDVESKFPCRLANASKDMLVSALLINQLL
jgi:hypothetical protein